MLEVGSLAGVIPDGLIGAMWSIMDAPESLHEILSCHENPHIVLVLKGSEFPAELSDSPVDGAGMEFRSSDCFVGVVFGPPE